MLVNVNIGGKKTSIIEANQTMQTVRLENYNDYLVMVAQYTVLHLLPIYRDQFSA